MEAGVNYPWFSYGWDFGPAPPGWRNGNDRAWVPQIGQHLQRLAAIGISVVRWFILGDGLTYGTGPDAPKLDRFATRGKAGWRSLSACQTGFIPVLSIVRLRAARDIAARTPMPIAIIDGMLRSCNIFVAG